MRDKFRGIVLGSAIGDAIGKSFEDLDVYEIESFYKSLPIDNFVEPHPSSPACFQRYNETSDETTIVRLLLESITECKKLDIYNYFEKLRAWAYHEEKHRYPDPFTLKALYNISNGIEDDFNFSSVEGILRVVATSMLHFNSEDLAIESSKLVTALTHRSDTVLDASIIFSMMLLKAINNDSMLDDLQSRLELLEKFINRVNNINSKNMLRTLQSALEEKFPKDKAIIIIGNGNYVLESLGISLFYFLSDGINYPFETFVNAINSYYEFGGDTDSIGFITGALIGAYHGYKFLPPHLIENLEDYQDYIRLADELCSIACYD